jgi:hypothetical protein
MYKITVTILLWVLVANNAAQAQRRAKRAKPKPARTTVVTAFPTTPPPSKRTDEMDTLPTKNVLITSAYKPNLLPATKLNFGASPIAASINKPSLAYVIPNQNLVFSFLPASIQPLQLFVDTSSVWENSQYVKVGYGNFQTPFAEAAFSTGSLQRQFLGIQLGHIQNTGNINLQEFAKTYVQATGVWQGSHFKNSIAAGWERTAQNQYGIANNFVGNKDSLQRNFTTLQAGWELISQRPNSAGIATHTKLKYALFSDNFSNQEHTIQAALPFTKLLNNNSTIHLELGGQWALLTANTSFTNSIVTIQPGYQFTRKKASIYVGVQPTFTNNTLYWLPQVKLQHPIGSTPLTALAGAEGTVTLNSYRNLAGINPFLNPITTAQNTIDNRYYVGVKAVLNKHVNAQASVAYHSIQQAVLWLNNTQKMHQLQAVFANTLQALRLKGEIHYTLQQKLEAGVGITLTDFQRNSEAAAWGLLPIELSAQTKWWVLPGLQVNSQLHFWDGALYKNNQNQEQKLPAALIWNLGATYNFMPKWSVWLQANNLLNNQYQRWHSLPALGTNIMGGIVYSFK